MSDVLDIVEIAGSDPALVAALTAADLPTADLDDPGRLFFRVVSGSSTLGFAGLEVCGPDALLRSVVVPDAQRGRGHGRTIIDATLVQARRRGVTRAFLFTTSAVDFFVHLGFEIVPRSSAPEAILTTRQATKSCATASMLTRRL